MDPSWIAALVHLVVALVVAAGTLVGAKVLRVRARAPSPLQTDTYECGEEPDGLAWVQFHPRYYVIALLFVLFDVETIFILPWALEVADLGQLALFEMLGFAGVLLLGWAYALRKGALEWQ